MKIEEIGIIILAAGASSRMGVSKQMLPINGIPLLSRTIQTALDANFSTILVVLGSNADEHRIAANEFPVTTLYNSEWQKGIGTSIRAGIKHIKKDAAIRGAIILVCDQPTLSAAVLSDMVVKQHETQKPIVASRYANTLGVPALFSSSMFDELLLLEDGQGAKKVIERNASKVAAIEFASGEIDLDTPEEYDTFIKNGIT
ncbi:MAG TPA: nucleotidyltransferase family protein [Chryseosolibacter sp.]